MTRETGGWIRPQRHDPPTWDTPKSCRLVDGASDNAYISDWNAQTAFHLGLPGFAMINASLARSLEEGGLSHRAAEDLVAALDRGRPQRADPWMLAYAALLTALLVGGFGWTASQLNALDARVNARIDSLSTRVDALDAKVDALDAKVDALDAKVDALDAKVNTLDAKVDAIVERLIRLEKLIGE